MWSTKKNWGDLPKIGPVGPILKFQPIGQSGGKLDFQETLSDRTKLAIAHWFLSQLTPIFLQTESKTYI